METQISSRPHGMRQGTTDLNIDSTESQLCILGLMAR